MDEGRKRRIPFVKQSTQDFFAEGRHTDDVTLFDLLHGYFYARWPYLYIGFGLGEHPLAKPFWRAAASDG